jgi:hypothetical protein
VRQAPVTIKSAPSSCASRIQLSRTRSLLMYDHAGTTANAVPRQVTSDVVDVFLSGRLLAGFTDFDDGDAGRLAQEAEAAFDIGAVLASPIPAEFSRLIHEGGAERG